MREKISPLKRVSKVHFLCEEYVQPLTHTYFKLLMHAAAVVACRVVYVVVHSMQ